MVGGRMYMGLATVVIATGMMGPPEGRTVLAQGSILPSNLPIQFVTVSPATASTTVGGQRSFLVSATLTDPLSSTRSLGGGGGFWNLAFAPSIPVGSCGTGAQMFLSQGLVPDTSGVFHEVWSPSTPDTLKADGSMTRPYATPGASMSAALSCVNGAATGSMSAFWTGTQYDGTYTFDGVSGDISLIGLSWTSSDPAVASVDDRGIVTALAPGETTITAIYGSLCWGTTPGYAPCRGTVTGSATLTVAPPSGGGGGGGGGEGPPLTAGPDRTLECSAPGTSPVQLEGAIFFEPEIPLTYTWTGPFGTAFDLTPTVGLPLGANALTFTISDGARSASDGVVITLQDTVAPAIASVTASPSVLWAPNHKMAPVTLSVSAADVCDASLDCRIVSVTTNEGVAADMEITGALTLSVRSERSGGGTGRVYTATVECTDDRGHASRKSVDIVVPHNR